jgi:hypothetical protein
MIAYTTDHQPGDDRLCSRACQQQLCRDGDRIMVSIVGTATREADTLPVFGRRIFYLGAAMDSTSVTPVRITDGTEAWLLSLLGGKSYRVTAFLNYSTVAATTGAQITLSGLSQARAAGSIRGSVSPNAVASELAAPIATNSAATWTNIGLTTTGVGTGGSQGFIHMDFTVRLSSDGTISIDFATEIASSQATLLQGSTLILERLT